MVESRDSKTEPKYRQYHPYQQEFNFPIRNLYNLPTSPELLFEEEGLRSRRSWGENLQYYIGIGYLSGATLGTVHGSYRGIRAAEPGDTLKLKLNRVLNSGGQQGGKFGNSLGVVGLIFSGLESGIGHLRGTGDVLNTVFAGLGTGAVYRAVYRAASGPRSAAIAGAIGGITAAAAVGGKHMAKRYVPI